MWDQFIERHLAKEKLMSQATMERNYALERDGDYQPEARVCPFSDPAYTLDPTIACPVCGAYGGMSMLDHSVEDLCVD